MLKKVYALVGKTDIESGDVLLVASDKQIIIELEKVLTTYLKLKPNYPGFKILMNDKIIRDQYQESYGQWLANHLFKTLAPYEIFKIQEVPLIEE